MSEDSRALGLGLKASASPFVPRDPAPASAAAGSSDSSTPAVAAVNGAASVDKPIISDGTSSAAAAAVAAAVAGVAAGKAPKPAPKQPLSPVTSKLSAAAVAAAPFVPGTAATSSTSAAAAAAAAAATAAVAAVSATPAAAKAKQQGRGGKQQQQGRQQQQQQKQLQQNEEQPKDEPVDAREQRQQDERRDQKDAAKAPAGKMSAAAAAFVPKAPGSGPAAAGTPPPAAPPGSISQQQGRPQSAGSGAAAARLRSPLKGSNTPAAAAATPSPARGSGSRTGRQGGRNDGPGSARGGGGQGVGPGGSGMYGSGGFGGRGPPGFGAGLPGLGLGGSGGGPKRALLAQFQGNYQYAGAGGLGYSGGFHHHHPHHHQHHHGGGGGGKQLLSERFISEGLRQQLQQSNYLRQLQHTPVGDEPSLPDKIGVYHTLFPLEDIAAADAAGSSISAAWGVRTTALKGISARDGRAYALRVVCGKQVIPSLEMLSVVRQAVEAWSCLAGHPGLLVPLEGLVSSELDGSPSLVVVAGYVPGAVTLAQAHLQPTQTVSGLVHNTPSEELLWSYTVQLAGILRAAHSVGLALRSPALSATKVLLTPVGRLKVSGLGVSEALTGEVVPANSDDLLQLQRDDVAAMGQLLLQLACAVGSLPAPSLDFASAHYSSDFVRLLVLLLGVADGGAFSWRAVSALLGERLLLEMDSLAVFNEQLLEELSCEMENGRLFRLISKLSFVTDRPADAAGGAAGGWSDTGDRYLLQLFRDFVFHQGELDGGRVLDWGHVIECLNKLDAGVAEQVLLQSRDERSLLVVSYADIKRCIETAIAEIRSRPAAGGHSHLHHMPGGPGGVGGLMRPPHGVTMFHR